MTENYEKYPKLCNHDQQYSLCWVRDIYFLNRIFIQKLVSKYKSRFQTRINC